MDWEQFAKELSDEGFFELCSETPQSNVTNDEIQSYGVMSWADIQKMNESQNYENQRRQVLERIGNRTTLSFSLLRDIHSIRYPVATFGNVQGRFEFGRYFEACLTGEDLSSFKPSKQARLDAQTMVNNARLNDSLTDWLESPCATKQYHAVGIIDKLRIQGFLDFYLHCEGYEKYGADLKTTKERTLKGFEKSCHTWYYFAQAYIYCNIAYLDEFSFFASSKTNFKTFELVCTDEHLEIGEKQFNAMVDNLDYYKVKHLFTI